MRSNRLFYNRVYLPGAIDMAVDFGVGWRREVQEQLNDLDLIFLDPTDKPMLSEFACEDLENHQLRQEMLDAGDYDSLCANMKLIRSIDLRLADLCDFAIVYLDREVPSVGTHEEITTLNRRKVPILVHVKQGKKQLPGWIWGQIPHEHVFETWADLYAHIRQVAYSDEPETYNRWRFLDYGRLYKKDRLQVGDKTVFISPEDYDYLSMWNDEWVSGRDNMVYRYEEQGDNGLGIYTYMICEIAKRCGLAAGNRWFDVVPVLRDNNPLNLRRENLG